MPTRGKMGGRRLFVVRGRGIFPLDMLRYDACWPQASCDVKEMAKRPQSERYEERDVALLSDWRFAPTEDKWRSYGWAVTEARNIPKP